MRTNLQIKALGLIVLLTLSGCKKQFNEKPTIRFLMPSTHLIIQNDTIISFIVEPHDKDGSIDRVEFKKNETLVHSAVNYPYQFDWNVTTENNIGVYIIKAIAFDNLNASAEAEIQIQVNSFLTRWIGMYNGISRHWSSYPVQVNGQWQTINNIKYNKVLVNVTKSVRDTCLDFSITYNDSIINTRNGLKFLASGTHFSQWGGGSGYGSLNIGFVRDSLKYNYFQKCGIPCTSGIDFYIGKK